MLRSTDWILVIGGFLFYFLGGYVLYSALFAAVGSAVDQETETQQFMLPVTARNIVNSSYGKYKSPIHIARWLFGFPLYPSLTYSYDGPYPFGIPMCNLAYQWCCLLLPFSEPYGWPEGYRVGLLMYGKKVHL